jgi:hypothetical protein
VTSVDDGEVVLFWELPSKRGTRLLRELRTDLAGLDAEEFMAKWRGADA